MDMNGAIGHPRQELGYLAVLFHFHNSINRAGARVHSDSAFEIVLCNGPYSRIRSGLAVIPHIPAVVLSRALYCYSYCILSIVLSLPFLTIEL